MKPLNKFCNKLIYTVLIKAEKLDAEADRLRPSSRTDITHAKKILADVENDIGWVRTGCIDKYLEVIEPPHPDVLKDRLLKPLLGLRKKVRKLIADSKKYNVKRITISSKLVLYYKKGTNYKFFKKVYTMKCNYCGRHFQIAHKRYKQGVGKYCNNSCRMNGCLGKKYVN